VKKLIVAISVIAILAGSGLALAQGWGRGGGMGTGPGGSGYGPANPSAWCPRFNVAPGQVQRGIPPGQQAQPNAFRGNYGNYGYGPGYGMRGGMGYGRGAGRGYFSGPAW
jgi:hypothetical protein